MVGPVVALSLAILLPLHSDQEDLLTPDDLRYQPFVALLDYSGSDGDIAALREKVERERDEAIDAARKIEEQWEKDLAAARQSLEKLNRLSSEDTEAQARRRSRLHIEIAALERGIREKAKEREHGIPAKYEPQLARLWLAQQWPARRAEILERIRGGKAREREHGDVEDVGYRKLAGNAEEDIDTGQQAARQLFAGGWLPLELQDGDTQVYVQQVATRIASGSDLRIPLHVSVLDSRELKAFALPGGYLYVTSGVLGAAQTESELAGVLAREIARIAARHATRRTRMSFLPKLFVPAAQIVAGLFTGGPANPAAYYGVGYGVDGLGGLLGRALNGTDAKFQREADQLGIQYAWKAGYDPTGFVAFLDSISSVRAEGLLTEEPPLPERLLEMFSELSYLPQQKSSIPASEEFDSLKQRIKESR
jgi:hypothetical protein